MQVFWYSGQAETRHALAEYLSDQGYDVRCAETPEIPLNGEDLILLRLPPLIEEALVLVREFRRKAGDRTPIVAIGTWVLADEVAPILSRICSICSVAHSLTSLKATENAFGIRVCSNHRRCSLRQRRH